MDSNINNSEQTVQVWTALAFSRMVSPVFSLALSPARASELLQLSPIPSSTRGSLPSVGPASILSTFRPSVGVIVGVLTTMFAITFLLLLYAKHCTANSADTLRSDDEPATAPVPIVLDSGVDRAIIEALPIFSFASLRGPKEGLECAVCLGRYEDTETLRLLPKCKHAFHMNCVDTWLGEHSTCPLCRLRIEADDLLLVDEFLSGSKLREHQSSLLPKSTAAPTTSTEDTIQRALQFFVQREGDTGDSSTVSLEVQDGTGSSRKDHHTGSGIKDTAMDNSGVERRAEIGNGRFSGLSGRLGAISRVGLSGRWKRFLWTGTDSKDKFLLSDSLAQEEHLLRRPGHRIIVSDVFFQGRWSDFMPSDVLFLNPNTHLGDDNRMFISEGKDPLLSKSRSLPSRQSRTPRLCTHISLSRFGQASLSTTTGIDADRSETSASASASEIVLPRDAQLDLEAAAAPSNLIRDCRWAGDGVSKSPTKLLKRALSTGMRTNLHKLQTGNPRSYSEITGLQRLASQSSQITESSNALSEKTREWLSLAGKRMNVRKEEKVMMSTSNTPL
eukprot:c21432_g1_i2 orf=246-1922(-)